MAATLELNAKDNTQEVLFKQEQALLRLTEKYKNLVQESKRGSREATAGFDGLNQSLRGMIPTAGQLVSALGGITSVIGVVALCKSAYGEWQEMILGMGRTHKEFVDNLIADLARGRDAASAAQISAWLKTVPGVTPNEARQIFGGATAAGPVEGLERRQELTGAAAAAAPLEEGRLGEWGTLVGKVGRIAPGRSAQATAGLALKLQQLAGQHVEQLTGDKFMRAISTLKQAGVSEEESMAQMLVGLEQGQGRPGALISAAEAIDKEMKVIKPTRSHRVLTAEEKVKNRFAQADAAERQRLLQSDKEIRQVILGDQAIMYAQIDPRRVAARAGELRAAQQGDFIGAQVTAIQTGPEGLEGKQSRAAALAFRPLQAGNRELGSYRERLDRAMQEDFKTQGWYAGLIESMKIGILKRTMDRPDRALAQELEQRAQPQAGVLQWKSDEERQVLMGRAGAWKQFAANEDAIEEAKKRGKLLEAIERNTRGPQPAAIQQNVTQHGEGK